MGAIVTVTGASAPFAPLFKTCCIISKPIFYYLLKVLSFIKVIFLLKRQIIALYANVTVLYVNITFFMPETLIKHAKRHVRTYQFHGYYDLLRRNGVMTAK